MMANKDREITIKVKLDGNNAVKGSAQVKQSVKGIEGQAKKTSKGLNRLQKSLGSYAKLAGGAAATAIGVALYKGFERSIRKGEEFESKLAELKAITGVTDDALKQIGDRSLQLSVKYGTAASNIVEANKLVASQLAQKIDFNTAAGLKQLQAISEQAIVLQKAAGVQLQEAVSTTTSVINQFNLKASESNRVINTLAAGAKYGAAEVPYLQQAMKDAGAAAFGAGQDLETTTAAIEELAANGQRAETAGRSLRSIFTRLQSKSKQLAEAGLKNVNVRSDGLVKTLKKLKPILNDTATLSKIFGQETLNQIQILIRNADAVDTLTGKVKGTNTAYQQAKTRMDTFKGASNQLSAAIDKNLIAAFEESNGAGVKLIHTLTDIVTATGDAVSAINRMIKRSDRVRNIAGTQDNSFYNINPLAAFDEDQAEKTLDTLIAKTRDFKNKVNAAAAQEQTFTAQRKGLDKKSDLYEEFSGRIGQAQQQLFGLRNTAKQAIQDKKAEIKRLKATNSEYGLQKEQLRELQKQYKAADGAIGGRLEMLKLERRQTQNQIKKYKDNAAAQKVYKESLKGINKQIKAEKDAVKKANEQAAKNATGTKNQAAQTKGLTGQIKKQEKALKAIINQSGTLKDADIRRAQAIRARIEQLKKLQRQREALSRGGAAAESVRVQRRNEGYDIQADDVRVTGEQQSFLNNDSGVSGKDRRIMQEQELQLALRKTGEAHRTVSEIATEGTQNQIGLRKQLASQIGRTAASEVRYADTAKGALKGIIKGTINAIIANWVKNALQTAGASGPLALALSPVLAAGAVKAASALTQPLLNFQSGGVLNGPSHKQGGIPIRRGNRVVAEAQGDEAIINRKSTRLYYDELSAINEAGGGKRFPSAGRTVTAPASYSRGGTLKKTIGQRYAADKINSEMIARAVREGMEQATIVAPVQIQRFDEDLQDNRRIERQIGNDV